MWLYVFSETYTEQSQKAVDVAMVMDGVKMIAMDQGIKSIVKVNVRLCLKKLDPWRCFSGLGVSHRVEQGTMAY